MRFIGHRHIFSSCCCVTLLTIASLSTSCAGPESLEEDESSTSTSTSGNNTSPTTGNTGNTTTPTNTSSPTSNTTTPTTGGGTTSTGTGVTIMDECQTNETECIDATQYRRCTVQESGNVWDAPVACEFTCSSTTGRCCGPGCSPGTKRCNGAEVETCEVKDGCPVWSAPAACDPGKECSGNGECSEPVSSCMTNCIKDALRCDLEGGTTYKQCVEVEPGCFQFPPVSQTCPTNQVCESNRCVPKAQCTDMCTTQGMMECVAGQQKECQRNTLGCLEWKVVGNCAPAQTCYSTTLMRPVNSGECVQTSQTNVNSGCGGTPGCEWAFCDNGVWDYQCTPVRGLGRCQSVSTRFGHSTCP